MQGRAALVTAIIRNRRVNLVLDTGANVSVLHQTVAAELRLQPAPADGAVLLTVGASRPSAGAVLPGLQIGGLSIPAMTVAVDPDVPADGVLGLDVLSRFDVDLDLGHTRLALHPAGGCANQLPPADPPFQAVQATRALATSAGAGAPAASYLLIPATLDGATTLAMLDTGALAGSLVSNGFAASTGVGLQALAKDAPLSVQGFGTEAILRRHRFTELRVARETIPTPSLLVGGVQPAFAMVLGQDYIVAHRLWLDFAGNRVLIAKTGARPRPSAP